MAKLTYRQRKAMPKRTFAIPTRKSKRNPAGRGAYPIEDASHARSALQRVEQFGSPQEKRSVRGAVQRRYPGMQKSHLPAGRKPGTRRKAV